MSYPLRTTYAPKTEAEFAEALRLIRLDRGLKQSYVARYIDQSASNLSNKEAARQKIPADEMFKMLRLYKTDLKLVEKDKKSTVYSIPNEETLVKRLHEIRKKRKLSQAKASELINTSLQTFSSRERGVYSYRTDELCKLAEMYDIELVLIVKEID